MNPIAATFNANGNASSTTRSKSQLDMETFLRLLSVQLANQNPLEPMSDGDFYSQLAQLGQVQGIDKLNASSEITQSAALMGRTVTAVRPMTDGSDGANLLITGEVVRIQIKDGERILGVREANGGIVDIRPENIQEIS